MRTTVELHDGLIAEDVAETFPSLVTYDEEGQPHTMRYDLLASLLLGQIQKQSAEIDALHDTAAHLRRRLERLANRKLDR